MSGLYRGRFFLAVVLLLWCQSNPLIEAMCVPLKKSMCSGLRYNMTILPNYFGHRTQSEAMKGLEKYERMKPLAQIQCSNAISLFLCSMFFPMCTVLQTVIPPCRSMCLSARTGCEPVMNKYGIKWPDSIDCKRFPEVGEQTCVFENRSASAPTPSNPSQATRKQKIVSLKIRRKICWESQNTAKKGCCRQGNRAAKILGQCSLKMPKTLSRKKTRLLKMANKSCSANRINKRCYHSCCQYKKRQIKNRSKRRRKSKGRKRQRNN